MNGNSQQQSEDRIETVFAALRHAEPAPGMEQRITAALLRIGDEASTGRSSWTWLRMPQLAAMAAVLAAGVLLSIQAFRRHAAVPAQAGISVSTSRAVPVNRGNPTPPVESATAHVAAVERSRLPVQNRTQAAKPSAGEGLQPPGQAELEQGFPAPPLPLTEQERLLVRLVHRDDPLQLSQLTPAAREAGLQRHNEQVREFFMPPPMLAANFTLEPYPTPGGTE